MAVAGSAALLLIIFRVLVRTDDRPKPFERTITDVELVWRCDTGHEFHAAGQVEARACWTCGRSAYPVTRYECPVHGEFEVSVKFKQSQAGVAEPSELRLAPRDWVPADKPLECPRCRRAMTRVPTDSRLPTVREPIPRPDRRDRG